jgi:hypothetical protein
MLQWHRRDEQQDYQANEQCDQKRPVDALTEAEGCGVVRA